MKNNREKIQTIPVSVYLSPEEYENLKYLAKKNKMSMARFLREPLINPLESEAGL